MNLRTKAHSAGPALRVRNAAHSDRMDHLSHSRRVHVPKCQRSALPSWYRARLSENQKKKMKRGKYNKCHNLVVGSSWACRRGPGSRRRSSQLLRSARKRRCALRLRGCQNRDQLFKRCAFLNLFVRSGQIPKLIWTLFEKSSNFG